MWPFMKIVKRPSRWYTAFRLRNMLIKDGMGVGMAWAIAIHQVTWDYDNWSKEDDKWFWKHLEADEQALTSE